MMHDRRNQYTRPLAYRPVAISILALLAVALIIAHFVTVRGNPVAEDGEQTAQVRSDAAVTMNEGCAVVQQLTYARCGHSLTRRQTLPTELIGKARADAEAAYEPYRVTSFSSDEICMEQSLDMFCPEHLVLLPDESGMLCVFENRYGDALALVQETQVLLTSLPAAWQEDALPGIAFDTMEEIAQWIESAES